MLYLLNNLAPDYPELLAVLTDAAHALHMSETHESINHLAKFGKT